MSSTLQEDSRAAGHFHGQRAAPPMSPWNAWAISRPIRAPSWRRSRRVQGHGGRFFRRLGYENFGMRRGRARGSPLQKWPACVRPEPAMRCRASGHGPAEPAQTRGLDSRDVEAALSLLAGGRRICIAGFRNGRVLAQYAWALLTQLRDGVVLVPGAGLNLAGSGAGRRVAGDGFPPPRDLAQAHRRTRQPRGRKGRGADGSHSHRAAGAFGPGPALRQQRLGGLRLLRRRHQPDQSSVLGPGPQARTGARANACSTSNNYMNTTATCIAEPQEETT